MQIYVRVKAGILGVIPYIAAWFEARWSSVQAGSSRRTGEEIVDKQVLSPEGHRSELDCIRWALVSRGPLFLTAGTPHSIISDAERDQALLEAGWTANDLRRALRAFLDA